MTAADRLDEIAYEQFENGDGSEAVARCHADGYPTSLDCTCGHGHSRHSGRADNTRCSSYIYQDDCDCTVFVPAPGSTARLWRSAKAMHSALRAVLLRHVAEPYAQGPDYCDECEHRWPCDTYAAVEAALGEAS